MIKHVYSNANAAIRLHEDTPNFKIERGVRQGNVSSKLFTNLFENMFKRTYIENLRFTDDLVLITDNCKEVKEMLNEPDLASRHVELNINIRKTKLMTNLVAGENIWVNNWKSEQVYSYKYLGHGIRLGRDNQTCEIDSSICPTRAAFRKLCDILRSDISLSLQRKVYNQRVLPVLTYGSETLTVTKKPVNKIRVAQRNM